MSTKEELQETINALKLLHHDFEIKVSELETENAGLQEAIAARDKDIERDAGTIDGLTEQLNKTVTVEDSGHDDPGVERETKVERQARLRRR